MLLKKMIFERFLESFKRFSKRIRCTDSFWLIWCSLECDVSTASRALTGSIAISILLLMRSKPGLLHAPHDITQLAAGQQRNTFMYRAPFLSQQFDIFPRLLKARMPKLFL